MAGIKVRKLTAAQMRKELKGCTKEDLSALLEGIYKSCPDAANYLNVRFAGNEFEEALLDDAIDRLHDCFFTKKGKARLGLPAAKAVIDDFEKACPGISSVLELKLAYIENGMEIIEHYRGIPSSLYSGVERMFQSLAKDMNAIEDPELGNKLALRFEKRLAEIGRDFGLGEAGFHMSMNDTYCTIRWRHSASAAGKEAALIEAAEKHLLSASADISQESAIPEPAPITDSADILPPEDGDLFYKIFFPFLDFVNGKLHINNLKNLGEKKSLDPSAVKEIAKAVWSDTSLIGEYLAAHGSALPLEHQAILKSWERCISGRFVLERNLKNGGILISLDDESVYQVRGIKSSFEEMYYYHSLPVMIDATLLPFKGVIITDGLLGTMNVFLGSGVKKQMKDIYTAAKRRKQIITKL